MKKIFFIAFVLCLSICSWAQESLIADIMSVEPVEIVVSDSYKEAKEDFEKRMTDEKAKVDKLLDRHGEKYKKEVTALIKNFNKILAKGIEQDVKNEKDRIYTKCRSLSFALRKNKRFTVTQFQNRMTAEVNQLPKELKVEKEMEVKDVVSEFGEQFDAEFDANQKVIKAFKETEHLTKKFSEEE